MRELASRLAVVFCTCAALDRAESFNSLFDGHYESNGSDTHHSITMSALVGEDLKSHAGLSGNGILQREFPGQPITDDITKAVKKIVDANCNVDSLLSPYHANEHFDSEHWDAIHIINTHWFNVFNAIQLKNYETAQDELGRAMHTIQDFYSHSTWVDLLLTSPCPALISGRIEDLGPRIQSASTVTCGAAGTAVAITNCITDPTTILLTQHAKITSGYWSLGCFPGPFIGCGCFYYHPDPGPPTLVPPGKCRHGGITDSLTEGLFGEGINKDTASSPLHKAAAYLARQSTFDFVEALKGELESRFPGTGRAKLGRLLGVAPKITFFGAMVARENVYENIPAIILDNVDPAPCYDYDAGPTLFPSGGYSTSTDESFSPAPVNLSISIYQWDSSWNPSDPRPANPPVLTESFTLNTTNSSHDVFLDELGTAPGTSYLLTVDASSSTRSGGVRYQFTVPGYSALSGYDRGCQDGNTVTATTGGSVSEETHELWVYIDRTNYSFCTPGWYGFSTNGFTPSSPFQCHVSRPTYEDPETGEMYEYGSPRWRINFPVETHARERMGAGVPASITSCDLYEFKQDAVHPGFFPLSQSPLAGATNLVNVVLDGDYVAARFETTNSTGARQALQGITNVPSAMSNEWMGAIVIPTGTFKVRVRTVDANGVQESLLSDDFVPSSLSITPPVVQEIDDDQAITISFGITNGASTGAYHFDAWPSLAQFCKVVSLVPSSVLLGPGAGTNVQLTISVTNLISGAGDSLTYQDAVNLSFVASSTNLAPNSISVSIPVHHPLTLFSESITTGQTNFLGSNVVTSAASYDVSTSGTGTGTNDELYFLSQNVIGDFDARVQIAAFAGGASNAAACLMVRENSDSSSPFVGVLDGNLLGTNSFSTTYRNAAGVSSQPWPYGATVNGVALSNAWLRLVRQAGIFTGFGSTNGNDWFMLGAVTHESACAVELGLATWSGGTGGPPVTVSFKNFQVGDQFAPEITSPPAGITVPQSGAALLSVGACSSRPLAYQWFFNGDPLVGQTLSSLQIPSVAPSNAGPYFVVVSNTVGSVTSLVATITVTVPAPPAFSTVTISGSMFSATLTSSITADYSIESSTNLEDWSSLAVLSVTNGSAVFTNPLTNQSPQLFYRARLLQSDMGDGNNNRINE